MKWMGWNHIKDALADKDTLGLKLFFMFSTVYVVTTGGDHRKIKLFLFCLLVSVLIFFVKNFKQPLLWYLFLAVLINDLICDYFVRANHHFLMIYLTISVIIYLHNSHLEDFTRNIKLLTAIVLLFSGIQKWIAPQFVSGDFYYFMMNIGSFFKPLWYYNSEINEMVMNNKTQIAELIKTDPNEYKSITLQNIAPNLDVKSRVFSWMAIGMEIISALLILWKPKHIVTHIIFILLVSGIFMTRLESGFLTLLAICGLWLSNNIIVRGIYVVLAIIFMATVLTKVGFY